MAEIKLNDSFTSEVNSFRLAGEAIDTKAINSISVDGLSLPTVSEYQDRLWRILKVIHQFKHLVDKDASDMDALAASLRAADMSGH